MELILRNETIGSGDIVVTSGIEPGVPMGLVIGTVSRVDVEPNSFSQTAWIQPLLDINNLSMVSILLPQ